MGEPAVMLKNLENLLTDIKGQLQYTDCEGKVISITEAFKQLPDLTAKYAELKARLEDMEARARERKWANVPGVNEGKEKFSFFKAFRAIVNKDWSEAGYEKDVFEETRQKAMAAGTDIAGGYLVPAQAMGELIEMFRAETVCIQRGARLIDNLQGSSVYFPKQTGGATVYWVGENVEIPASEPTVGQIQMTPKKAAAMVQLSNSLIRMSNPSAEQLVREDISRAVALAVDIAALRGSGASNQPRGIANTPGINTVALGDNGATLSSFDLFYDMEYQLALDNALRGNLGYVFHHVVKRNIKKLKVKQYAEDTGGEYVVSAPTDPQIEAWLGWPFSLTTQLPLNLVKGTATNCTEVYFGNWQELLIGQWAGMSILASQEAGNAFAYDQTWIRIITEVDVALRHTESFCLCNDLKIA